MSTDTRSTPRQLAASDFAAGAVEKVGQFTTIARADRGRKYVVVRDVKHRAGAEVRTTDSVWCARTLAVVLERARADQRKIAA